MEEKEEKLVVKEESVTQKLREAKDILALKVKALQEKNKALVAKVKAQSILLREKGEGLVAKLKGLLPKTEIYEIKMFSGEVYVGSIKSYSPVLLEVKTVEKNVLLLPMSNIAFSKKI